MLSSFPVDLKEVTPLGGLKPTKISDEQADSFKKRLEDMLKAQYTKPVNLENHASQQVYAEVIVNGKSVATVYNGGSMQSSNATHSKIKNLPSVANPQGSGPELAQQRAEAIAKALGGTVVKSKTAISQTQWNNTPPVEFKTDYAGLEQAMNAMFNRSASTQALLDAQSLSQKQTG